MTMYWSPVSCALQLNFASRENKQRNAHSEESVRCVKEGDVYTGVSTIRYRKAMLPKEFQLQPPQEQTASTEMTSKEESYETQQEEESVIQNMESNVSNEADDEELKEFWSHVCHVAQLDGLHFHAFTSSSSSSSSVRTPSTMMISKDMKPLEINNYKVTVVNVESDNLVISHNNNIDSTTPENVKKGTSLKVLRVINEDEEEWKVMHSQHHHASLNRSSSSVTNCSSYANHVAKCTILPQELSQESNNVEECRNSSNKQTRKDKDKAAKRENYNTKSYANKSNKKATIDGKEMKSCSGNDNESSDVGSKIVQFEQSALLPLHCEVDLTISFSGVVQNGNTGAIYSPLLSQTEQHQRNASQSTKSSSSSSSPNSFVNTNNNSSSSYSASKSTSQTITAKRNGKNKPRDNNNNNNVMCSSNNNNNWDDNMQSISTEAILLTHFEVQLARCAFPCPDDPHYRIKWQLQQLTLPMCYHTVVSNGQVLYSHSSFDQNYSSLPNRSSIKRNVQLGNVQYGFTECGPLPAYVFAFACFAGPPLLHVEELTERMTNKTCLFYVTEYLSSSLSSSSSVQKTPSFLSSPLLETLSCTLKSGKLNEETFSDNVNVKTEEIWQATKEMTKSSSSSSLPLLLSSIVHDMEEMYLDNYEDVQLQVKVMALPCSGVSMQTLHKVAKTASHAITWLEHFFHCPLPLLMCNNLIICIVPTMPYISGMEHHCCIFLNQSIYTDKKSFAGVANKDSNNNNNREIEQVELVIHELAHHWIGNALGLSFAQKEGVCQLLEQLAGDVLRGKSMRKLKPTACVDTSLRTAPPPSTIASKEDYKTTNNVSDTSEKECKQDENSFYSNKYTSHFTTNNSNNNDNNKYNSSKVQREKIECHVQQQQNQLLITEERKTEAIQKGNEFTGHVYQHALLHIRNIVAEHGFDAFAAAMQKCVCEHLLLYQYRSCIVESLAKHSWKCDDSATMRNECSADHNYNYNNSGVIDQDELIYAPFLSEPQFLSYFCETASYKTQ